MPCRIIPFFPILWILFLFVGCAQDSKKIYGGALRIGIYHKPTEINPLTTDSSISANLLNLLFNRLLCVSDEEAIKPEVAKRLEISSDHLTWTFYLRNDIRFHNGELLNAHDVKFTYDEIRKRKSLGRTNLVQSLREVRVIDDYTVQFVLSQPDHVLWAGLCEIFIVPKRLLESDPTYAQFNRHPVGSGPFRFISQDGKEIILGVNEQYFDGRPYLDRIEIKILPSQQTSLTHLIAGKIDMAFLLNPEDYGALSKISSIRVYHNWNPIVHLLTFNLKKDLFAGSEIRKALNLAVDKERIVRQGLKGGGMVAGGAYVPGKYDFRSEVNPYPYRPDLAVQIFNKQGWELRGEDDVLEKRGKRFEFTAFAFQGEELSTKTLQFVQEDLRRLGIKMNITLLPFDEYIERVYRQRNFESNLTQLAFHPFYDNDFLFWHSSQIEKGLNFSSYINPQVDDLLETARLAPDPNDRKKAWLEAQKVLHDDPPGVFLFWRDMPIAVHARFKGIPEKNMESLRDLVNVWEERGE